MICRRPLSRVGKRTFPQKFMWQISLWVCYSIHDDEVFIIDTKLETEFHKIQDVKEDMMSELHTQTESDFYKEAVTWKI